MGDFNVIKNLTEVDGGLAIWGGEMQDLKDCMSDLMVDDIHDTDPLFTWLNGQDSNPTYKSWIELWEMLNG